MKSNFNHIIKIGDEMCTRSAVALELLIEVIMKPSFWVVLKIIRMKPMNHLSFLIMLGMIVVGYRKGKLKKDKKNWPEWIRQHIWSHIGIAYPDEYGLHIKESVIQGFRRRRFDDHYSWDHNAVKFMRFNTPLTESQIYTLIKVSDQLIQENKGYQFLSILNWAIIVVRLLIESRKEIDNKPSKFDLFFDSKKWTICYESGHRQFKAILPLEFTGDSEKVSLYDIYRPDIMHVIF